MQPRRCKAGFCALERISVGYYLLDLLASHGVLVGLGSLYSSGLELECPTSYLSGHIGTSKP